MVQVLQVGMWLVRAFYVLATYAPIGVDTRYGSGYWSNTGFAARSTACFIYASIASTE